MSNPIPENARLITTSPASSHIKTAMFAVAPVHPGLALRTTEVFATPQTDASRELFVRLGLGTRAHRKVCVLVTVRIISPSINRPFSGPEIIDTDIIRPDLTSEELLQVVQDSLRHPLLAGFPLSEAYVKKMTAAFLAATKGQGGAGFPIAPSSRPEGSREAREAAKKGAEAKASKATKAFQKVTQARHEARPGVVSSERALARMKKTGEFVAPKKAVKKAAKPTAEG